MIVMVDEQTGDKHTRAVGQKGTGGGDEREWLLNDMSEELKSWDTKAERQATSSSKAMERPLSRPSRQRLRRSMATKL